MWKKDEIEALALDDFDVISDYYNINKRGNWEHGNYILLRHFEDEEIAKKHRLTLDQLQEKVSTFNIKAMAERDKRIRPGLDDKSLTSWNALASKGLCEAYMATSEKSWLDLAEKNLDFLTSKQMMNDGKLWHNYKNGTSNINGYLEDYAHLIDALLKHYEATLDVESLKKTKVLVEYVFQNFDRTENGMFYFKSKNDPELVSKKAEVTDNVIPASNSVFATCLFKLSLILADDSLYDLSRSMLAQMEGNFNQYPGGYSQWMLLHQYQSMPYFELAIVGKDCSQKVKEVHHSYLPNVVICGGEDESTIPILEGKFVEEETYFYACKHGACQLPTSDFNEVLGQIH